MNAVVLDGSRRGDDATAAVGDLLVEKLEAGGFAVRRTVARDLEVAPCRGCFRCWVDTPGVCTLDDDARDVTRDIATSDLVVFVSPVTFGGYAPELKRLLDRSIGVLLPFFKTIDGETHHRFRYPAAARLLVVGVQAQTDEGAAALFRSLATRNGVNLHAPAFAAGVISSDQGPAARENAVSGLLAEVGVGGTGAGRPACALPEAVVTEKRLLSTAVGAVGAAGVGVKPRKALLLVGSPRRKRSTSAALGGYLMRGLEEAGVSTGTLLVGDVAAPGGTSRLEAALDGVDLLVLAFPLYVDALPAPLVAALEHVAASAARSGGRPLRVAALVNSGFPEARQNTFALAVCRRFAAESGFQWAGGLALGGGGALDGRDPAAAGGMARNVRRSLDLAVDALAVGDALPGEAVQAMAKPITPALFYRMIGEFGFRRQAKRLGARKRLYDRPHAPATERSDDGSRQRPEVAA